ncbi:MAG: lysophospholipase [Saprospiraceae bacterium]|nr:lysophospholipase [Saprospiraceae bacterium]MCF8248805.1 lysophospholipase [Saprospiraceae bacterium]MCF8279904.1 lysophospholipase [Bacteroidales bacterium]MCF8310090.1 lysophospholipase [Saprospiraceae bacterium]MCF8438990.1 lysophospholipase [Saprospiraceae bacterium]
MQVFDFQQENKNKALLQFRHWQIANTRAVVCIVHGLGEHIGRYNHVAQFFSLENIATIGFDLQGHGRTVGKRGHTEGLESMLDDVDLLLKTAQDKYPGKPVFIYGHSMGGNVVLNYVLRRKPKIAGLIATAAWIQLPKPPSPFIVLFGKIMNFIIPKLTQPNGLDINELSNDPTVVKAYKNDPLVHDRISVRAGTSLLEGASWLDNFSGEMPCPTLLLHGGIDRITSPIGTAEFAKRVNGDVTWKEWEGLKHEIHNEPQQGEVLGFLVEWMERFI